MTRERSIDDEYRYELEAAERVKAAVGSAFGNPAPGRRWRDIQVVAAASPVRPGTSGRALISRRPDPVQQRYEQAVWVEREAGGRFGGEFDLAICAACQVLEEEAAELVAGPLRPVAGRLAAGVRAGGDRRDADRAEALEKWAAGEWQTTLGVISMALMGLRRGLDRGDPELAVAAAAAFTDRLVGAIRSKKLAAALDRIRDGFRNPVAHRERRGEPKYRPFAAVEYAAFAGLLVGADRVEGWEQTGPAVPGPPDDAGFLHHLLTGSRLLPTVELPPASAAADRLSALAAPRPGAVGVEVLPRAGGAGGQFREIDVEGARQQPGFRLGGEVAFQVRSDRDGYLTLIDIGTGGAVSALLPNEWCPAPRLTAGRAEVFPGPAFGDFRLRLGGKPGRERVVAVVTAGPPPVPLLPPPGGGFLRLTDDRITALAAAVERLPGGDWGAAACEFTIAE